MNLLTIAIPTFNRAGKLHERLQELLPQLTPEVGIHVFDNASTDDTAGVVAAWNNPSVSYSRSIGNVGMCGNFIRFFVTPQSEWLWILGDDDPVQPDANGRFLRLSKSTRSDIISFQTNCNHNEHHSCSGNISGSGAGIDLELSPVIS